MANNIDKKEPVTNCEQSKIDIIKCDNHELAGNIEPLIKVIRGQQVMLDRDLATLYGVETKRLNEQVKRNIKRFPEDFMFQLTKDECLRSQIATLNEGRGQHLKYMPYVFTENGVAMLSSVLRSDTAIEVNIRIMRAFTSMRHFLQNNAEVFQRLSTMEYHQLDYSINSFLNAGMRYDFNSRWSASANINNLFNRKDYEVSLYQKANFQYYRVPLRGREFMISLRLKY